MADASQGVPIGAVTRMTGVTAHTLRKWESRYAIVEPIRSDTGRRLYRQVDIEKLLRVRDLVDRGHPIGSLAALSMTELAALLARSLAMGRPAGGADEATHVTIVGHVVGAAARLNAAQFSTSVQLDMVAANAGRWLDESDLDSLDTDVVVLECATLPRVVVRHVHDLADRLRVVIVYGFATSVVLRALQLAGVMCLRAPLSIASLAAAIDVAAGPIAVDRDRASTAPRFSPETIARVASVAPSIRCECPQHVAQLLFDLGAFEQYSLECIDTQPHDRILHAYLRDVAAAARSLFEDALERVAIAEGIDLA